MHEWGLAGIALLLIGYAGVSGRLASTPVTQAMVFVALGLLVGNRVLHLVEADTANQYVRLLAEATLALVLFTDAVRVNRHRLRREALVPARLLGLGPAAHDRGRHRGRAGAVRRARPVDGGRPGHHAGPDRRRPGAAGDQQPAPALAHPPGPERRERPERRRLRPAADHLPHRRRGRGGRRGPGAGAGGPGADRLRGRRRGRGRRPRRPGPARPGGQGLDGGDLDPDQHAGDAAARLRDRRRAGGQRVHRRLRRRDHLRRRRPTSGPSRPPSWPSSPGSC